MGPRRRGRGEGEGEPGPSIDIQELVEEVKERGIGLPLLIRFSDLLETRIRQIHGAFHQAIAAYGYTGDYRGVYPIKVNQNRFLVEDLVKFGREFHYGLEAGSKPELLAVMALLDDPEALIVCNGYKDEEYIETALLASRLGPKVILVAEKPAELQHIVEVANRTGIRPVLGMRARLSSKGAGHWEGRAATAPSSGSSARETSGGRRIPAQRGHARPPGAAALPPRQPDLEHPQHQGRHPRGRLALLQPGEDGRALRLLRRRRRTRGRLRRQPVELRVVDELQPAGIRQRRGGRPDGGLRSGGRAPPHVVTEAGRATVAHHAVLVAEVLGVGEFRVGELPDEMPKGAGVVLQNLHEAYTTIAPHNVREVYHDAQQYREDVLNLFNLGHMSLEHRVLAEDLYWAVCSRVRDLVRDLPYVPPELQGIEYALADTYFCNFSLFQSLPDSWAIDQLFPVAPIHRLDEEPTRRGILADITCDSDGKVDRFVRSADQPRFEAEAVRRVLELHEVGDDPYHLGFFLVGAYQEILGDLHNLFGDTHAVHVSVDEDGEYEIEHVVSGDSVTEVLQYVEYHRDDLVARVRRRAERAIRRKKLSREEARHLMRTYEEGLAGYTYLERD